MFGDVLAMNLMDFFIVAMFLCIAGAGFFFGVARTASAMISMYLATIISATFYERLGENIQSVMGSISIGAAYFVSFVMLFLGSTALFSIVIITTLKPTSQSRRFAILDNLGGASVSVVIAFVAIAMSLAITVVMIQAAVVASGGASGGGMGFLDEQMDTSSLAPLFLRLLPILTSAVQPWFPGGLPPILTEAGNV